MLTEHVLWMQNFMFNSFSKRVDIPLLEHSSNENILHQESMIVISQTKPLVEFCVNVTLSNFGISFPIVCQGKQRFCMECAARLSWKERDRVDRMS